MVKIKPKLLIDVDTGVDDALAILYLSSFNKFDLSITTTGGNCKIEDVVNNTLGLVEKFNLKINVYKGATKPIVKDIFQHAYNFHGKDGIGNLNLTHTNKVKSLEADDFIIEFLSSDISKKTLVWLSPLTNLAMALLKDPPITNYIDRLIIMGGVVDIKGNETEYSEFNFFQDPHAAKIVFDHLDSKIQLITLDVTDKCPIKMNDLKKLNTNNTGKFTKKIISNWYQYFGDTNKRDFLLYDPLTVSVLFDTFVEFDKDKFNIETENKKQGHLSRNGKYGISYSKSVDAQKFIEDFISRINRMGA